MDSTLTSGTRRKFSAAEAREDFPILKTSVRQNKPLVYLDNAATTQKPSFVIETVDAFYRKDNANIHRAVHHLSERATIAYDDARSKVQNFIGARSPAEVIFTRGTTEAINLVAHAYAACNLKAGDEVLISYMEHHSNIVPWQLLAERTGAKLRVIPMDDRGVLDMDAARRIFAEGKVKLLSIVHVSNALGTVNPVQDLVNLAKEHGALSLVDGAQSIQHLPVNVQELDADFFAFSGHKIYAPTGIGVLYGRESLLEKMQPYQGGGDMISSVTFENSTWAQPPSKFEAGTPNIAGAIGLGAALDYLSAFDIADIAAHEQDLLDYTVEQLAQIPSVRLIGQAPERAGAVSFLIDDIHPHDIGTMLDRDGVAIRTGHHCAQPVMDFFDVSATARASFALYNTRADVDAFIESLHRTIKIFS